MSITSLSLHDIFFPPPSSTNHVLHGNTKMYYFITFLTTENVEGENVVLSGQLTCKRRADGWGGGEGTVTESRK